MSDIVNKIQEHNANRKLQILKGFVEVEDVLEKAVYSDNSQNRKLQRVGKTYGGKKEDEKSDKKDIVNRSSENKNTPKADNQKVDYTDKDNVEQMKVHAKDTETDDLKSFLESADPNDEDDAQLIKYATEELKSRGELSDKKEDEKSEDEDEKISHEQHMLLSEAMGDGSDYKDADEFLEQVKDGEVTMQSDDFKDLSDETIKNWFDENLAAKQENDLHNKLSKVDKSVEDLKKHLTPKSDKQPTKKEVQSANGLEDLFSLAKRAGMDGYENMNKIMLKDKLLKFLGK